MSYLCNFIHEINQSYPHLGELSAVCQLTIEAKKVCLVVSPSGCGKSTAMKFVVRQYSDVLEATQISTAWFSRTPERFNSFRGTIFIDDISSINYEAMRLNTFNTIVTLCHEHRIEPHSYIVDFTIEDFYGASLIGIQPKLLRNFMLETIWETQIQDKTLRYYYMYRPLKPKKEPPNLKIRKGIGIDKVEDFEPNTELESWQKLVYLGNMQWSRGRIKEHITDYLKAIASLEHRNRVIPDDYDLLAYLLKPMAIEGLAAQKQELDSDRILDNNLLLLLTEYYSYNGKFSLDDLSLDHKGITHQQADRIMISGNNRVFWQKISKSPTYFTASNELKKLLIAYGLEVVGNEFSLL